MKIPFTDDYVKMAVEADELQLLSDMAFQSGNFTIDVPSARSISKTGPGEYAHLHIPEGGGRWIPRLDQMFSLLRWKSLDDLTIEIYNSDDTDSIYVCSYLSGVIDVKDDIHETLLRMWMFREHKKKWSGKAWVSK